MQIRKVVNTGRQWLIYLSEEMRKELEIEEGKENYVRIDFQDGKLIIQKIKEV